MRKTLVSAIVHKSVSSLAAQRAPSLAAQHVPSLAAQRAPSHTIPSWVPKLIAYKPEAPGSDSSKGVCNLKKVERELLAAHGARLSTLFRTLSCTCEHLCQHSVAASAESPAVELSY